MKILTKGVYMKSKLLALSLFGFGFSISSVAQTSSVSVAPYSDFVGVYGQISTGWDQNTAQSSSPSITTSKYGSATGTASDTGSWGYTPLNVGVGYIFEVMPKWTLGVGADYSLYMPNSNTVATDFKGQLANGKVSYYYTAKDRYNLYVTPGYAIDKDKLAYVKLGYTSEIIQIKNPNDGRATNSDRVGGYILGVGYKQIISGGFYGFGEANYLGYSSSTLSTPTINATSQARFNVNQNVSAYNFLVGVGYKY